MSISASPALDPGFTPTPDPLSFRAQPLVPLLLFVIDVCSVQCSLLLGFALRRLVSDWIPIDISVEQLTQLSIGILLLPVVIGSIGLYPGYCVGPVERLRKRTYATVAVFFSLTAWDELVLHGMWSRGVLLSTLVFAIALPSVAEAVARYFLTVRGYWGVPVIVLGAGEAGAAIVRVLQRERGLGLVGIGVLDDAPELWNTSVHGIPVLGPLSLASQMSDHAAVALIAMPSLSTMRLDCIMRQLSFSRVILIPPFVGIETHWVTSRDLGGYLGLEIRNHLCSRWNMVFKRGIDITISIPLFVLSLPVLGFFAAWIKLVSPGPAFYFQHREGRGGKSIRVWKLRTMYPNASQLLQHHLATHPLAQAEWQRFFKLKYDPRIIPFIGSLLRRSSFDELPQLWNIVAGDMSLVGPRPFPHYHLNHFPEEFRVLRRRVLPGLTGFWQVFERSNGDLLVQERLDTYYIRNWSLWLDFYLLIQTIRAVISGSGAC